MPTAAVTVAIGIGRFSVKISPSAFQFQTQSLSQKFNQTRLLSCYAKPSDQHHNSISKQLKDSSLSISSFKNQGRIILIPNSNHIFQRRDMTTTPKVPRSIWNDALKALDVRDISVTDYPHTANFTCPGLSLESFNQYGNARLQSLLTNAVVTRIYMYHMPYNAAGDTFLDWQKVTSDRLTFMSSTEATFSKSLYDPSVDKSRFDVKLSLGYCGNASVALVTEYYETGKRDVPLLRQVSQTVSVSKTTRKPIPFPEWFKNKYTGKGVLDQGLVLRPFDRPENTYAYDVKVRWNDTDTYNHTNFASYITFTESAIYSALANKPDSLGDITEEDVRSGCKNIKISYQNESLEGQTLNCYVWQDASGAVKCSIERDGGRICQLVLRY